MAFALAIVLLCVSARAVDASKKSEVTPVQKVVQLMEGMLEKGKKEKHGEQVQFASYKQEPVFLKRPACHSTCDPNPPHPPPACMTCRGRSCAQFFLTSSLIIRANSQDPSPDRE